MAKRETELKNFFSLTLQRLKHDIRPCWCHQRSPEAGSGTWILTRPKVISILTETHINHDQMHHTRNNWLGDSHTKGMLFLLHLSLEGVTEVDTDRKGRFVSFKVTTSNESSVCAPSGYSTKEQLARGHFFEGLQNYMQNKKEGNENKMLGDLNCTMIK